MSVSWRGLRSSGSDPVLHGGVLLLRTSSALRRRLLAGCLTPASTRNGGFSEDLYLGMQCRRHSHAGRPVAW